MSLLKSLFERILRFNFLVRLKVIYQVLVIIGVMTAALIVQGWFGISTINTMQVIYS